MASAGASAILPVLVLPIIANAIGPVDFGFLSTARFTMQLMGFAVGSFLGFGLARVFYDIPAPQYFARINGANLTVLALGLIWGGVAWITLPLLPLPDLPLGLLAGLVLLGAVGFVWRQNYHRILVMIPRPGLAAGSELAFNIMIFAALLGVLYGGGNWVQMVASQTAIFLATTLISAGIVFWLRGTVGAVTLDLPWSRENFTRSLPFVIVGLVTPLLLTMDKFIIAGVLGAEAMGIYAATSLYLSGMFLLSGVFSKVYVPGSYQALSQYHDTADTTHLRLAQKRLRLSLMAILPLTVILALICTMHAGLALDARYAPAVTITWLVVTAGASAFVQVALIPFFDSFHRARLMSRLAFVGLALSAAGLWLGAQLAGLWGAALGLALGQVAYVGLSLLLYLRLDLSPDQKS